MRFNTSHVVIYPSEGSGAYLVWKVSIHLMLLFIFLFQPPYRFNKTVSIHLMLLFIAQMDMSKHLEIYVSIHLMLLFIVCFFSANSCSSTSFNTSHVVIYPAQHRAGGEGGNSFNTSHVVIYRRIEGI